MIIIDSREPKKVFQYFNQKNLNYKTEPLAYGDYLILGVKNIVVERKDIFDFFNSIESGRLWEQLHGIEKYDGYQKILIIEGNISKVMAVRKAVTFARYIGSLTSILAGWNIAVITTSSFEATMLLLEKLDAKIDGNHTAEYRIPTIEKEGRTLEKEALDVILAVEGIGGKTAEELLEKFKSLKSIFKQTKEKLSKVIGEKKAEHLIEVLEYEKKGNGK